MTARQAARSASQEARQAAGKARRCAVQAPGCSGAATVYRVTEAGGARRWQCQGCAASAVLAQAAAAAGVTAQAAPVTGEAARLLTDAATVAVRCQACGAGWRTDVRSALPEAGGAPCLVAACGGRGVPAAPPRTAQGGRTCGACGSAGATVRGRYRRTRPAPLSRRTEAVALASAARGGRLAGEAARRTSREAAADRAAAAEAAAEAVEARGVGAIVAGWLCQGCAADGEAAAEAARLVAQADRLAAAGTPEAVAAATVQRASLAAWSQCQEAARQEYRRQAIGAAWQVLAGREAAARRVAAEAEAAGAAAVAARDACHAAADAGTEAAARAAVAAAERAAVLAGADVGALATAQAQEARRGSGPLAVALRMAQEAERAAERAARRARDASPLAVIADRCGAHDGAAERATGAVIAAAVAACQRAYPAPPAAVLAADRVEWRDVSGRRRGPSGTYLPVRDAGWLSLADVARREAARAVRYGDRTEAGGRHADACDCGRCGVRLVSLPDGAALESMPGTLGSGPARQWGGAPAVAPHDAVEAPARAVPLSLVRPAVASAAVLAGGAPVLYRDASAPVGLRADALRRMVPADRDALARLVTATPEAVAQVTDGRRREADAARRLVAAYREAVAAAEADALAAAAADAAWSVGDRDAGWRQAARMTPDRGYRPVAERAALASDDGRQAEARQRAAVRLAPMPGRLARQAARAAEARQEAERAASLVAPAPYGPPTRWQAEAAGMTPDALLRLAWLRWAQESRQETGGGAAARSGRRLVAVRSLSPAAQAVARQARRDAAAWQRAWSQAEAPQA